MKKLTALLLILSISFLTLAHEFWLQPKKFRYKVGEDVTIDFFVGENFTGEPWFDTKTHKVETMQVLSAYGKKDLKSGVKTTKENNLTYKLTNEGTHLFSMSSNAGYIELDAKKFNEYLEEDGLENIREIRKKNGQQDKPSRENYSRFAKLLVQSGNKVDDIYKRKVGFRVEIIPLQNPYTLKTGDYLECEILFDGKPLPHQMVKIWSYLGNRSFLQDAYTESDGHVKFPISNAGPWMVSFVKMVESTKENVDYESMWASLVFGIE